LGNKGICEHLRAIYEWYRAAGRKAKHMILSEFCASTGYHRKYAICLLNGPRPEKRRSPGLRSEREAFCLRGVAHRFRCHRIAGAPEVR